ncbi:hypothetical protein CTEN210_06313 [Chaetoceros tenuissimus]|uniref:GST N-terminal domain-containing protein n=1 Tax=Chaetoceros tenuissimus TaxID=426638 RepID=A0AAD3CPT5_9STRA|nr:hypothetical protein CTEN210_06313 [Chaetoceros tenuissimus]
MLQNCKLTYFNIPGRGEAIRLALTLGGISFTDERIQFSDWRETIKPTTPYGSLPVLVLSNGSAVAQQRAILRFVGKETSLYSSDSFEAAKVDEMMDACEDIISKTFSVGSGLEKEEKEAARMEACKEGGVTYEMLKKIDTVISSNKANIRKKVRNNPEICKYYDGLVDSINVPDAYKVQH